MNDSLYSFEIFFNFGKSLGSSKWNKLSTPDHPSTGLINYGMAVTNNGNIVIYGGVTETVIPTRFNRVLTTYSDLWFFNTSANIINFSLIGLGIDGGGFSRIVSLGGEIVCIINRNMKGQMIILDTENMVVSPIDEEISMPNGNLRNGFGAIPVGPDRFLIVGGHEEGMGAVFKSQGPFIYGVIFIKENNAI